MHTDTHPQGESPGSDVATLSLSETARAFRVHPATIRRWIDAGRIPAYQVNKGGAYRISRAAVDALLAEKKAA